MTKTIPSRSLCLLSSFLLLTAGCGCDDEVHTAHALLTASPDELRLGAVPVGTTDAEATSSLRSDGTVSLRIDRVIVEDDPAGVFELREAPRAGSSLAPGRGAEVTVGFAPTEEGSYEAALVIESNDPDSPARVPLTGSALAPSIQLCLGIDDPDEEDLDCAEPGEPLLLDFGAVSEGGSEERTALVRNVGRGRLMLEEPSLDAQADSSGFSPGRGMEAAAIPQGGGVLLSVTFEGAGQGEVTGAVELSSNDPNAPLARVLLAAEGRPNTAPIACAAVTRVEGLDGSVSEPPEPAAEVVARPRDRLYLTAHPFEDCSFDLEDGLSLTYLWRVVEQPEGESAFLSNERSGPSPETSPPQPPPSVDVAGLGTYRVELVVYDSLGAESAPAEVVIEVAPDDDLIVELEWEVEADLDLHLIAPGSSLVEERLFCHPLDCFWDTCRPATPGVPVLHWGNVGGVVGDDGDPDTDPILRFDNLGDTIQRGTERTRLETVSLYRAAVVDEVLGPYLIGVGFFDARGHAESFDATVTVMSKGELLYRSTRTFLASEEQAFWVAGSFDAAALDGEALSGPLFEGMSYAGSPGACD